MPEFERLLNMRELQDALAAYLPSRPDSRTIHRAIENGMPFMANPAGKKPRFLLSACLKWFHSKATHKARTNSTATDAAIRAARDKFRPKRP